MVFPLAFLGLNAVLYPSLNRPPSRAQLQLFLQFARITTSLHRPQAPRVARGSPDHRGHSKSIWSVAGRENEGSSRSGRRAGKRLYGCRFVIGDVKNGVELGDLQYVMNFIVQVQELQFTRLLADGDIGADELA